MFCDQGLINSATLQRVYQKRKHLKLNEKNFFFISLMYVHIPDIYCSLNLAITGVSQQRITITNLSLRERYINRTRPSLSWQVSEMEARHSARQTPMRQRS